MEPQRLKEHRLIGLIFFPRGFWYTRAVLRNHGHQPGVPSHAIQTLYSGSEKGDPVGDVRSLDQATISLIPEAELLHEAVKLSVEIKHTLQDCMYLAAARELNARLVTADRPFHERAVRFYKHIALLPGCEATSVNVGFTPILPTSSLLRLHNGGLLGYKVQPFRYSLWTNCWASGAFVTLSFSASHVILFPLR
jgi:hypothetical protein